MQGKLCCYCRGKWGKLRMRCRGNSNSSVAALCCAKSSNQAYLLLVNKVLARTDTAFVEDTVVQYCKSVLNWHC